MTAAVILDRDGTLIDFVRDAEQGIVTPAFHPAQLRLLPGVPAGLRALRDAGFTLAIATNQPDAAKGRVPVAAIERTNRGLTRLLADEGIELAAFETCLHHPEGGPRGDRALIGPCTCRKPAPGMLLRIAERLGTSPESTWMLGDTVADWKAAKAAGMRFGMVLPERRCELCSVADQTTPSERPELRSDRFDRLVTAVIHATAKHRR